MKSIYGQQTKRGSYQLNKKGLSNRKKRRGESVGKIPGTVHEKGSWKRWRAAYRRRVAGMGWVVELNR